MGIKLTYFIWDFFNVCNKKERSRPIHKIRTDLCSASVTLCRLFVSVWHCVNLENFEFDIIHEIFGAVSCKIRPRLEFCDLWVIFNFTVWTTRFISAFSNTLAMPNLPLLNRVAVDILLVVQALFINLSKAFDFLQPDILANKLLSTGIYPSLISLVLSYLITTYTMCEI